MKLMEKEAELLGTLSKQKDWQPVAFFTDGAYSGTAAIQAKLRLRVLTALGFAEEHIGDRARRTYKITDAGRAHLAELAKVPKPKPKRPVGPPPEVE